MIFNLDLSSAISCDVSRIVSLEMESTISVILGETASPPAVAVVVAVSSFLVGGTVEL